MSGPISQLEHAWRDTLLAKAEGAAIDDLARLYGIPRLFSFARTAWRKGLRAVAWGARGTPGTTHAFLEGIFSEHVADLTFVVRLYPSQPGLLYWVSGGGLGGFKQQHVGRLVRVTSSLGSTLHWSRGPHFNVSALPSSTLNLVEIPTAYWDAANWAAIAAEDLDEGQTYQTATAVILPFTYRESTPGPIIDVDGSENGTSPGEACVYRVSLDAGIFTFPASYLQPDGQDTPEGMPYGGTLVPDATVDGDTPPPLAPDATPPDAIPGEGPFALYLGATAIPGLPGTIDAMLAAGVQAYADTVDFGVGA